MNFNSMSKRLKKSQTAQTAQITQITQITQMARIRQIDEYIEALEILAMSIDLRHADTQAHSRRLAKYSMRLAKEVGLVETSLEDINSGSLLHDIGKVEIPDWILMKPAKLTPNERKELEKHTIYGYRMIKEIKLLSGAKSIVLYHHERYDGKGYPKRISKGEIPLEVRIFTVMDAYDAITSDRPYRKRSCHEVAKVELLKGSGTQFDPEVVAAFSSVPQSEWKELRAEAEAEVAAKIVTNPRSQRLDFFHSYFFDLSMKQF